MTHSIVPLEYLLTKMTLLTQFIVYMTHYLKAQLATAPANAFLTEPLDAFIQVMK
jgi:hypothetical protein